MRIRSRYLCILLLSASLSFAEYSRNPIDYKLQEFADIACSRLKSECERYSRMCTLTHTSLPNSCLVFTFLELEAAKERCGTEHFESCYKKNIRYKSKFNVELNIPNLSNPKRIEILDRCDRVGSHDFTSEYLRLFTIEFLSVFGEVKNPRIKDDESYYNCVKQLLNDTKKPTRKYKDTHRLN